MDEAGVACRSTCLSLPIFNMMERGREGDVCKCERERMQVERRFGVRKANEMNKGERGRRGEEEDALVTDNTFFFFSV